MSNLVSADVADLVLSKKRWEKRCKEEQELFDRFGAANHYERKAILDEVASIVRQRTDEYIMNLMISGCNDINIFSRTFYVLLSERNLQSKKIKVGKYRFKVRFNHAAGMYQVRCKFAPDKIIIWYV